MKNEKKFPRKKKVVTEKKIMGWTQKKYFYKCYDKNFFLRKSKSI
jgi:hypothetical protein